MKDFSQSLSWSLRKAYVDHDWRIEMSKQRAAGDWQAAFADRHIGPDEAEIAAMLEALGFSALEPFIAAAVPQAIRSSAASSSSPSANGAGSSSGCVERVNQVL